MLAQIRKVGFACVSHGLGLSTNHTFRLANLSLNRLRQAIEQNLGDLESLLQWMQPRGLQSFRLGSSLIPFAAHPSMPCDWTELCGDRLFALGQNWQAAGMRFSMCPGQYTPLNSPAQDVRRQARAELTYGCGVLDRMGLDLSHKVLITAGGGETDKRDSAQRLMREIDLLDDVQRRRLVLKNDERNFTFADVVALSEELAIPASFDLHHHQINPSGPLPDLFFRAVKQWDCVPEIHLSSQKTYARAGAHDTLIHEEDLQWLCESIPFEVDVMVEAKSKEAAALQVLHWLREHGGLAEKIAV